MKTPATIKHSLWQVNVETRDGNLLPVGPSMIKEACEEFAYTIRTQIAAGKEKTWTDAHVVQNLVLN